jgi:hypothetical protein
MVNLDFGSLGSVRTVFWKIELLDQMYAKVGRRTLLSVVWTYGGPPPDVH